MSISAPFLTMWTMWGHGLQEERSQQLQAEAAAQLQQQQQGASQLQAQVDELQEANSKLLAGVSQLHSTLVDRGQVGVA